MSDKTFYMIFDHGFGFNRNKQILMNILGKQTAANCKTLIILLRGHTSADEFGICEILQ